jgi:prepilin-type processing-associated H-X9-DG protein
MSCGQPQSRSRAGFTLFEAIVTVVVILVVVGVAIPFFFRGRESVHRSACGLTLRNIGQALDAYHAQFNTYPCASRYAHNPESPWGTTWWWEIMPFAQKGSTFQKEWKHVVSEGQFDGPIPNPNTALVDGLSLDMMHCPSSPLPQRNDPMKHISSESRTQIKGTPQGIAVPCYVAISGSVPDAHATSQIPLDRTTKEGPYGILSGSGVFPVNQQTRKTYIRDGLQHTIMIGEQSDWGLDTYYEPAVKYDLRSAWPAGAFTGTSGNYHLLNHAVESSDSTAAERAYNVTSVRYPINTKELKPGIVAQNVTPIPTELPEGKKPKPIVKLPPGPGHNHGIFSAHPGGANVLFADGRAVFLSEKIDLYVLGMLCTIDDQKLLDETKILKGD